MVRVRHRQVGKVLQRYVEEGFSERKDDHLASRLLHLVHAVVVLDRHRLLSRLDYFRKTRHGCSYVLGFQSGHVRRLFSSNSDSNRVGSTLASLDHTSISSHCSWYAADGQSVPNNTRSGE